MHWIDPHHLPETHGTLERFLLDPHGTIDGFLLRDGPEVHVPPHLSVALRAIVKPGDPVRVRGVRPRGVDMISAVQVSGASGDGVTDDGPPAHHDRPGPKDGPRREPRTVEGTVARHLHGPRGEVRGALLDDGTVLRWPPHESSWIGELARPSARLHVRGEALSTPETLRELAPPPKPGPDGHKPPPKGGPEGHKLPPPKPGPEGHKLPPPKGPPGHEPPKGGPGDPGARH